MIRGSCLCGASAFEISGAVSSMQICYCSRCRKASGSAFGTELLTAAKSFRWLRGDELVRAFELPSGFFHAFCTVCGSPMPGPDIDGKVPLAMTYHFVEQPSRSRLRETSSPWARATNRGVSIESRETAVPSRGEKREARLRVHDVGETGFPHGEDSNVQTSSLAFAPSTTSITTSTTTSTPIPTR